MRRAGHCWAEIQRQLTHEPCHCDCSGPEICMSELIDAGTSFTDLDKEEPQEVPDPFATYLTRQQLNRPSHTDTAHWDAGEDALYSDHGDHNDHLI